MERKIRLTIFFVIITFISTLANSQNLVRTDTLQVYKGYDNVHVRMLNSDSLVSTFSIWIKKEVKAHKHAAHSETIYILEGEGEMKLGSQVFIVKKGDYVFIPKNTVHSVIVTSKIPMKVLSIQAPEFDGSDRIFIDD